MKEYLIKLHFQSSLRIGQAGIGMENIVRRIHSDTIFSALCHTFSLLYSDDWVSAFLNEYERDPHFLISSAFPFSDDHLFLPRPMKRIEKWVNESDEQEAPKELKNLEYIGIENLRKWLFNEPCSLSELSEDNIRATESFKTLLLPRVALDRADNHSQLFYSACQVFAPNAGLYLILRAKTDVIPTLQSAFALLAENGLGSERSSGFGKFSIEWLDPPDALAELLHQQGNSFYLLSLFHPSQSTDHLDLTNSSYELEERRGWFYSQSTGVQLKRKTVWMFREGSVFSFQPRGHLVDVAPDEWNDQSHRIIRSGVPIYFSF